MTERFIFNILRTVLSSFVGAGVAGLTNLVYSKDIQEWVDVNPLSLNLPNLTPEFDGYRIVQISDFHIGTWLDRTHLEEAIHLVNLQRPDLVAITGDFVTYHPEKYRKDLVAALSHLTSSDGTVAILGNHDHWTDPSLIRQVLDESGIIDLSNDVYTIRRGKAQLHIAGVDDYADHLDRLDIVLEKLPEEGAAILLAHEPDFADISALSGHFDLQLSGHTHGGQIRIPYLGPLYLPRYGRKYPLGLYKIGNMIQYTNRGLGTAEIQLRLNCKAEITVFSLAAPISTAAGFEKILAHPMERDRFLNA